MLFTFFRAIAAVVLLSLSFGISWMFLVGGVLYMSSFSFFHNGLLYQVGNWLDGVYPKGFFDEATNSDAMSNFDFKDRLAMFIISLLILLF
jgi:hypothetical protein